jgi:transposase InsO family protein
VEALASQGPRPHAGKKGLFTEGAPAKDASERRREERHVRRMRTIASARTRKDGRRGPGRQESTLEACRLVQCSSLAVSRWLSRRGHPEEGAANRIGLSPRTLRSWSLRWEEDRLKARPRGRPVEPVDREIGNAIFSFFVDFGTDVPVTVLAREFPHVARAEIRERKERMVKAFYRRNAFHTYTLRWQKVGSVWAADFSRPPLPVDGIFPRILAVRDLSSLYQLEVLPAPAEDAETARGVVEALIRKHGPPLVFKTDNGSAFREETVTDLLEEHGVIPLFSPPYTPQFNGSIESGFSRVKVHAHYRSARNDRAGRWTCGDVAAARHRGNWLSRPRGPHRPSPRERWVNRGRISDRLRDRLRRAYDAAKDELTKKAIEEGGILPLIGPSPSEKAAIERNAIAKALVECELLRIRRKRFTPTVSSRIPAMISR